MSEKNLNKNKKNSFDWLVRGVLTKIGDTFDRFTGRGYKSSSSLATSELIEKLKILLDAEVEGNDTSGKFVPHNIKLKMQWDKFSTDSEKAIQKLEDELHIAAIDHINDRRYYTHAPINIEIKPDYFTEGVQLLASFDKFDKEKGEVAVNVTVPEFKIEGLTPPDERSIEVKKEIFLLSFTLNGKLIEKEFAFEAGERKSVGRTKENDLTIDDISVSKIHAALVFNSQDQLVLADTGSSNGTFINGDRIAYGRAFPVNDGDLLKFGTIEVSLEYLVSESEDLLVEEERLPETNDEKQITSGEISSISEVFERDEIVENLKDNELDEEHSSNPNIVIIRKEEEPKKDIDKPDFLEENETSVEKEDSSSTKQEII